MDEQFDNLDRSKRFYLLPQATEVSPEQAAEFVKDGAKCSDSKAKQIMDLLLRHEELHRQYRQGT